MRSGNRRPADVVVTDPGPDNVVPIAGTAQEEDAPAAMSEAELLRSGVRFSFRLRHFVGSDWREGA